jgi:hypothetical protein
MTSTPAAAASPRRPNANPDRPGDNDREPTVGGRSPAIDRLIGWAAVAAPTLLSAILVLHDLGSRSLWVDEGATVGYSSQHGAAALWRAITSDGGNMLAYYAGMHVVIRLFGSSPEVLRLPSAIAVILTVPVCYWLVRRLFDRRAATFSAFFVAASLPLVYWGQMARAYTVAVLLLSASTLAFVVALQTRRRTAWACYCLVSALAVWTILLAALVLAAQYCALAARRRTDVPVKQIAGSAAAVVTLSVPVALVALAHGSTQLGWLAATGPPLDATNRYLLKFLASAEQGGVPISGQARLLTVLTLAAWLLAGALCVACMARRRRGDESFAWALVIATFVLPAVATYAISELIHPVFSDRYLLTVVAPASMVAGIACSRIRPRPAAWLAGLAIVSLRLVAVAPSYNVPLESWQGATTFVLQRSQPHDCAAFFVADGYTVFDYYVHRLATSHETVPTPVLPESPWSIRHVYELDPATIPPAQLPALVASCPRLWLIETHQAGKAQAPGVPPYQVAKRTAYHRLMGEIDPSYVKIAATNFTAVRVVLYERRQSPTS